MLRKQLLSKKNFRGVPCPSIWIFLSQVHYSLWKHKSILNSTFLHFTLKCISLDEKIESYLDIAKNNFFWPFAWALDSQYQGHLKDSSTVKKFRSSLCCHFDYLISLPFFHKKELNCTKCIYISKAIFL